MFFGFDNKRQPDDIDTLWEAFAQAIAFAESDDAEARSAFVSAYDNATQRYGVGWNLTMGLYWIRPWNFPTLDGQSQHTPPTPGMLLAGGCIGTGREVTWRFMISIEIYTN